MAEAKGEDEQTPTCPRSAAPGLGWGRGRCALRSELCPSCTEWPGAAAFISLRVCKTGLNAPCFPPGLLRRGAGWSPGCHPGPR